MHVPSTVVKQTSTEFSVTANSHYVSPYGSTSLRKKHVPFMNAGTLTALHVNSI